MSNSSVSAPVLYGVLAADVLILAMIGLLLIFNRKSLMDNKKNINTLLRNQDCMMGYHDNFAEIHRVLDEKADHAIERQGKLANIIRTIQLEARRHDRKVDCVLRSLGEIPEEREDETKNPGA